MDVVLKGKRALVTGSNPGIGKGIVWLPAAEGMFAIVHDRNEARYRAVTGANYRVDGGQIHSIN